MASVVDTPLRDEMRWLRTATVAPEPIDSEQTRNINGDNHFQAIMRQVSEIHSSALTC